ncbi:hypothetical protein GPUN_2334 [Glaciecola punicea ACAM 611]|uniref:site-specific DNA-methyltransferase (adenine-specific) n=1 Tax=Glaciecola punicea ACAM 611 TaxID=1121923 RepID=H5TDS2_9ALTE|nr:BREX-1 system adenine-specific DNA-methyltransferase PglX [Glaciecola punicea]GAB56449.1 hypothetical protein GPUN_2334 [Glaciecola punicea ACAM 611]
MDTSKLKKFAQFARRSLIEQVQSKLKLVLAADSAARREHPKAIKELEQKLNQHINNKEDEKQLIEQVAYTWFNRFCALRFMDVNRYNRIMVLSPISGQFQPELLAEAKAGHLDDVVFNGKIRERIQGLLSGSVPSRDGQAEGYRMMIVAICNDYHRLMPYLFQRIEDYTELLMPDDLLSGNSILAYTREAMTPENCESVESIGWLYQFYVSEKKDLVFEELKKNKKITPENIPAATQLFTPHWIVKYLVENSLGRLWMLNNPNSKVIDQMEYYIKPLEKETDFLRISNPEEIKLCDPAVGSGHMLTYAYDLLYAIYLEANYDATDIPELILTKNLFGIEIDERAAELAAFALSMKAMKGNSADDSNNRRRFFRNPIKPNICRLEKVKIDADALDEYMDFIGRDLFTQDLRKTLSEFEEADNFGSLIQPTLKNPTEILEIFEAKNAQVDLFLKNTHESVIKILQQTKYLSPIYHVVSANPPYMGRNGMNSRLSNWAKDNYPKSKSDLFAMFIERNLNLILESGYSGMINMQSWMFLSSFEKLRVKMFAQSTIVSMVHLGSKAFDSIGGEVVSTTAYILQNTVKVDRKGDYFRLVDGKSEAEKNRAFSEAIRKIDCGSNYRASTKDFNRIPGSPVVYWASDKVITAFESEVVEDNFLAKKGMAIGDNNRFLRLWSEVENKDIEFNAQDEEDTKIKKWYPCLHGGAFRKWSSNKEFVVNWIANGFEPKSAITEKTGDHWSRYIISTKLFFKEGINWSAISSSSFSARYHEKGFAFTSASMTAFPKLEIDPKVLLLFINSEVGKLFLSFLSPTLNFGIAEIKKLPFIINDRQSNLIAIAEQLVVLSTEDWDEHETSWSFKSSPLLNFSHIPLSDSYNRLREIWRTRTQNMKELEERSNQIFINVYGLENDLKPDVMISKISLFCNPSFRYKNSSNTNEAEGELLADTARDFISYACGCIFGRYSLDKEGLVLANQNDTIKNCMKEVVLPEFMPDEDNVIPIIDFELEKDKDEYWFEDDITERFIEFLQVSLGEKHLATNLDFIEKAIGKKIKSYFARHFYTDHVRRYKKRPIYWMFSSPKGSFNALIYMHRYQPDTASIVLNDYLREFRTKLEARKQSYEQVEISASASQKDKTQAIKAIAKINKVLEEINDYEHDVLYPLAGEKIEIDLDDGVKHNYPLFGNALKKVTGLS